jgi:hypothetical protein
MEQIKVATFAGPGTRLACGWTEDRSWRMGYR